MVQKVAYYAPPPIKKGEFVETARTNINKFIKILSSTETELLAQSTLLEKINTFFSMHSCPLGKEIQKVLENAAKIADPLNIATYMSLCSKLLLPLTEEKWLKLHYANNKETYKAESVEEPVGGDDKAKTVKVYVNVSYVEACFPKDTNFITASKSGLNKISPADTKTIAEFVSKVGAISVDLKNGLNIYEGKTFAVKKKELYDDWKSLFSQDTNGAVFGDLLAVVNNFPQETIPVQELVSAIKAILASKFDNKTLGVKAGACVNCLAVSTSVDGKALAALLETYKAEK
jgi:hypothetical protein